MKSKNKVIPINYKKFENNKKKENNEPFDLEKYIDDINLYHKQREVLDLLEILEAINREKAKMRAKMNIPKEAPEIRVRLVKLDTSLDLELLKEKWNREKTAFLTENFQKHTWKELLRELPFGKMEIVEKAKPRKETIKPSKMKIEWIN